MAIFNGINIKVNGKPIPIHTAQAQEACPKLGALLAIAKSEVKAPEMSDFVKRQVARNNK